MPGVKTAISLDEELLIKVNRIASDLHVSRSKVFTLAVKDYLKKQENQSPLSCQVYFPPNKKRKQVLGRLLYGLRCKKTLSLS